MTLWANPTGSPVRVKARLGLVHVEFACEPGDLVEIPSSLDAAVPVKAPQLIRAEAATDKAEPKAEEPAPAAPETAGESEADPFTGEPKGARKAKR